MTAAPLIGRLRQRLTLQRESGTPDAGGGYALGWVDLATVWGAVEALTGRERLQAAALESTVTHRMLLRARTDIDAAMRVVWRGRAFNIRAHLDRTGRDRLTELLVEEGGAV